MLPLPLMLNLLKTSLRDPLLMPLLSLLVTLILLVLLPLLALVLLAHMLAWMRSMPLLLRCWFLYYYKVRWPRCWLSNKLSNWWCWFRINGLRVNRRRIYRLLCFSHP
uniref:Uncharacterized protein n=1 Tax=Picea glauca TaxID=3330 RepID=A0A101LYC0_PICGL|nr:hypothetical protein ABT39_MTgene5644 [Picea glauca]